MFVIGISALVVALDRAQAEMFNARCAGAQGGPGIDWQPDVNAKQCLLQVIRLLKLQCQGFQLAETKNRIQRFEFQLQGAASIAVTQRMIVQELDEIKAIVFRELQKSKFLILDSEKEGFFHRDSLFGDQVNQAFPSAASDIKEAGNCLAMELNTAAIFHLMRAVEIGLRTWARHLKVRIKRTPLEYAEWGTLIGQIEKKIDLITLKPRGPKKSEALEFYRGVLGEFNAFKDVWRNNIMHSRRSYNQDEAKEVCSHVRGFMQRLSRRVSERP